VPKTLCQSCFYFFPLNDHFPCLTTEETVCLTPHMILWNCSPHIPASSSYERNNLEWVSGKMKRKLP
jgi:hypothetical protein